MTFLFSPCWRYSYWTFGINVGNLLEPSLCHHEVCVLDVGSDFLSLVHVQLLKDVAVNSRKIYIVPSGIILNWSCKCGVFLRWQVVASIFMKILYLHNKPLTNLFKTFTIFFHVLPTRIQWCFIAVSSYWCNCLWAIAILLIFLEPYTIVHILRIQQHYLPDIHQNYLFGHTKFAVWFHLTRAESQAAMMVGILQGFDIGLVEIRWGCYCGWNN
jgi:hypothetical protein